MNFTAPGWSRNNHARLRKESAKAKADEKSIKVHPGAVMPNSSTAFVDAQREFLNSPLGKIYEDNTGRTIMRDANGDVVIQGEGAQASAFFIDGRGANRPYGQWVFLPVAKPAPPAATP